MNPFACQLALRPRDPLDVLDLCMALVRARARPLWRATRWVVLPIAAALAVAAWATDGHWGVGIAAILVGPLVQAPLTLLGGRLLFADDASVKDAVRDAAARIGPLLGAGAAAVGVVAVSSLTCFAVLPVAMIPIAFRAEAVLLERVDVGRALRRASRLAGAHPGGAAAAVFGRYALTVWMVGLAEATGQGVAGTVLQLGEPFGSLWSGDVTPYAVVGAVAAHALHALYRLLLYVDVRTRVEGWDLQVALRAAGMVA